MTWRPSKTPSRPYCRCVSSLDVACGITAGVDDIAERLEQGFRLIIVTSPEALSVGRAAAGRSLGQRSTVPQRFKPLPCPVER